MITIGLDPDRDRHSVCPEAELTSWVETVIQLLSADDKSSPFKMHKIIYFPENLEKKSRFHLNLGRVVFH